MPVENTTNKLHAKIALVIKAHKKRLFRNHRDGMDIVDAISKFTEKVNEDLTCAVPDNPESVESATLGKPEDCNRQRGKLAAAIHEILTNDETPATLFNAVADFVCVASSGDTMETFWTPPILEHMLEWSKTHSLDARREEATQ